MQMENNTFRIFHPDLIFVNETTDLSIFSQFVHMAFPHIRTLRAFCFLTSIVGLVLNFLALDSARHIPEQTSSAFWMGRLAIWDSMALVCPGIIGNGFLALGVDFIAMNRYTCKLFSFNFFAAGTNASAHFVSVAIDRALKMAFPAWHREGQWTKTKGTMFLIYPRDAPCFEFPKHNRNYIISLIKEYYVNVKA